MKKILLIVMLIAINLFSAEFRIESFKRNDNDLTAKDKTTGFLDVNGNMCAIIKVSTEYKDIIFKSVLLEKVIATGEGQYWVFLPKKSKRLMIKKEGIIPFTYSFPENIEEGIVYDMKLTAEGLNTEVKRDGKISVVIITDQIDAELTFDGEKKGKINQIETEEGEHEIIIERSGYKKIERKITVNTENTFFEFKFDGVLNDDFIFVRGGLFEMGSNEGDSDEKSVHLVTVDDFFMSKYEVTQEQWKEVMGKNPSRFKGDSLPQEQVGWYDAVIFCNKLSELKGFESCYSIEGSKNTKDWGKVPVKYSRKWEEIECDWDANGFRLPTEAEWEYAAKGGIESMGFKYSGSDYPDPIAVYGWMPEMGKDGDHLKTTKKIGSRSPNELGIFDMTGNVFEWCWDIPHKYGWQERTNPRTADGSSYRIYRGGGWKSEVKDCRVAFRGKYADIKEGSDDIGFRLVCTPWK
ncbi:MAG: SUMF1/EgtB/PvdO family nonheme iron enzyme [Candidatus Delongbacteria bacterium]|nr:SUMF1/EgtB/PvdO family nonheme iron enzyme [Candidatus Delongbacteria bacterium]